ncbi:hypothetical protein ACH5RR_010106 [Cinchona calisaya]|uniref:Transmembrane protein n=1 Tax=Cinchona calisaya TaxID=153742 RepID=A0ABD3AGM1_9GENT
MATTSIATSPPSLSSSFIIKPKHQASLISFKSNLSTSSPRFGLKKPPHFSSTRKLSSYPNTPSEVPLRIRTTQRWKLSSAIKDNLFLLEAAANPVENSSELASTSEDGVSSIISVLLLVAFIGLSILTIGVIYIAVTDFLQKREREKFEKEEAATKKKGGKKGNIRIRARAGPRGFGQKIQEEDDDASE